MNEDCREYIFLLPPAQFETLTGKLRSSDDHVENDVLEFLFTTYPNPTTFDEESEHKVFLSWFTETYGDAESAALTAVERVSVLTFRCVAPDGVASHARSVATLLRGFDASPERLLPLIHGELKSVHQSSIRTIPKAPADGGSFMHHKMLELSERTKRAARDFSMTGEDVRRLRDFARQIGQPGGDGGAAMRAFVEQHGPGSNLLPAMISSLRYLDVLASHYAKAERAGLGVLHINFYG